MTDRTTTIDTARIDTASEDDAVRAMFKRKHGAGDDEVDMTPMVDVTFLLLIFFMVTAAFSLQKSLEVPTPDESEGATQSRTLDDLEDDNVIIRIDADDTVWVNDSMAPSEQAVLVKLREARSGPPGSSTPGPSSLMIVAHTDCSHETVVMALDAGSAVKMNRIWLTSSEEDF